MSLDDADFEQLLPRLDRRLQEATPRPLRGRLRRVRGLMVHASLPSVGIGELCYLRDPLTDRRIPAEVVGFEEEEAILSPIGAIEGLSNRAEVIPTGRSARVAVGDGLLGRIISPFGELLDRQGAPADPPSARWQPIHAEPPPPLTRGLIERPLTLGVRAIDGLNTVARGQRVGLFGAPGVGKSSLLSAIMAGTDAEIVVIGLVGERGREVRELLDVQLDPAARARTIAVVSTSDRPALERTRAAYTATAIAEHYRDQGRHVLLLVDSITRFARAQREIGLAAGEPPTRRGYPPSLFAALPRLLERAGPGDNGTITALYTVLTEGDESLDPVAEEARSILDGHIVLSESLAQRNHFPAIDVLASRSRLMDAVVSREHRAAAGRARELMARYRDVELLLQVGEYTQGQDADNDLAVERHTAIDAFLRQSFTDDSAAAFGATVDRLKALVE